MYFDTKIIDKMCFLWFLITVFGFVFFKKEKKRRESALDLANENEYNKYEKQAIGGNAP